MSSATPPKSSSPPKPQNNASLLVFAFALPILVAILALHPTARNLLTRAFASSPLTPILRKTVTTSAMSPAAFSITKRPWAARGKADHGWLYSFHTFSFASYYDPQFESFGPLRVINEDRVQRGTGFGTHAHREFHIWSYIVDGELEHRDSMGNLEILHRGEVQYTCAGTGIRHSEYNRNSTTDNHFLQIWAKPSVSGLQPRYSTRKFDDDMKKDKLCRIMESTERVQDKADGPIPMEADLSMAASILSPGKKVVHDLVQDGPRNVYLHVVMSGRVQPKTGGAKLQVGNETLGEGDGAFLRVPAATRSIEVESVGDTPAEFLLFDMGPD